jgi:hypothetical protein
MMVLLLFRQIPCSRNFGGLKKRQNFCDGLLEIYMVRFARTTIVVTQPIPFRITYFTLWDPIPANLVSTESRQSVFRRNTGESRAFSSLAVTGVSTDVGVYQQRSSNIPVAVSRKL